MQTTGENNCLNKRKLAGVLIKLGITDKKAMQQCLNEMMTSTGSKQIKGNNFLQWVFMEGKELDPKKLEAEQFKLKHRNLILPKKLTKYILTRQRANNIRLTKIPVNRRGSLRSENCKLYDEELNSCF